MKRVVSVVQVIALLSAAAFVVLLFANEPADDAAAPTDGAAVFSSACASCHGSDGGGGVGAQLSDGLVVDRYPDIEDEIAVITSGSGGMPGFGTRLSEAEIRAVAEYIRSL
jgi:mono/diheme cytochrome c family protein